jgi:tetratricopeptide (TPR) repeat protein
LVLEKPREFLYRQDLGKSLGTLGNVLTAAGRYSEAEEVVRRELKVRKALVDDFPSEPEAPHYLADAYADVAGLLIHTGKVQQAVEARRQEASLRKKTVAEFPNRVLPHLKLASCSVILGDVLRKTGAHDQAIAAYEECIAACKETVRRLPDDTGIYLSWGQAVAGMGAPNEAFAAWERAVLAAEDARVANRVAWFLATTSEPPNRHPEKAVQFAKQAIALAPQNANYWNTLGVASYRAGQWQDAVAALEKSLRLRSSGDSWDWFFLAMAHWQLGGAGKARHWYDQAVRWMDRNKPKDEELCRFRAEADALLGIEEKQIPKQSPRSK